MTRPRLLKPVVAHEPPIRATKANPRLTDETQPPGLSAHLAGWRRLEDVEPEPETMTTHDPEEARG